MAYAIGYQTGTYGNYAPFAGVETGGFYRRTEVASVAPGEHPEEVFAGAEIFFVEGGVIRSRRSASKRWWWREKSSLLVLWISG